MANAVSDVPYNVQDVVRETSLALYGPERALNEVLNLLQGEGPESGAVDPRAVAPGLVSEAQELLHRVHRLNGLACDIQRLLTSSKIVPIQGEAGYATYDGHAKLNAR